MRILQFRTNRNNVSYDALGIWTAAGILDVPAAAERLGILVPRSTDELISSQEAGLEALVALLDDLKASSVKQEDLWLAEDSISYLPIVTNPEKILCVGLNYQPHAAEMKMEKPQWPVIFSKYNNTLAGHKEKVFLPEGAFQFDYEIELVIIMGRQANKVTVADALGYVFGYTIGNDLSARDLQMRTGQWLIGKSCDGFAPVGPYIIPADIITPDHLELTCSVNGQRVQKGNTQDMIFSCAEIISYISQYMTLKPGDLIFTGTPSGVIMGKPKEQQIWLKSGDQISAEIKGIGSLETTLV